MIFLRKCEGGAYDFLLNRKIRRRHLGGGSGIYPDGKAGGVQLLRSG